MNLFIRRIITIFIILLIVLNSDYSNSSFKSLYENEERIENYLTNQNDYTKVKYYADRYAFTYDIPKPILYKLLETETGWGRIKNERYKANQIGDNGKSFGPGQIQLPTARLYRPNEKITKKMLLNDIKFNIETICIILSKEREHFSDIGGENDMWLFILSSYNMGRKGFERRNFEPNEYAENIVSHL